MTKTESSEAETTEALSLHDNPLFERNLEATTTMPAKASDARYDEHASAGSDVEGDFKAESDTDDINDVND